MDVGSRNVESLRAQSSPSAELRMEWGQLLGATVCRGPHSVCKR